MIARELSGPDSRARLARLSSPIIVAAAIRIWRALRPPHISRVYSSKATLCQGILIDDERTQDSTTILLVDQIQMSKRTKFYAVHRGSQTGVFDTWCVVEYLTRAE